MVKILYESVLYIMKEIVYIRKAFIDTFGTHFYLYLYYFLIISYEIIFFR